MSTREPRGILRAWVETECTIQMQGTLLTAIRGPDGEEKESPAKPIVRAVRACIIKNAKALGYGDVFMGDGSGIPTGAETARFFEDWDSHAFHWFMHLLHAIEIIAYKHPNSQMRTFWGEFYVHAVEALHLGIETPEQMEKRLRKDGNIEGAGCPCKVCAHNFVVPTPVRRCANCLAALPLMETPSPCTRLSSCTARGQHHMDCQSDQLKKLR